MTTSFLQDRRILVVEDDYMIAEDVRLELTQAGAVVVGPVPSVSRALDLLDNVAPVDAAILDVNLGTERSFPIAERLETLAIPFLFSTGYNSADIPPEWQHAMVVIKPFQIESVEQLLSGDDTP